MPPAKKTTSKATQKTAKKAVKRSTPRKLSAAHKNALAEGRTMSATVDRYVVAINAPKRRGRKVTKATLETRLVDARSQSKNATGVDKVMATQAVRGLQAKIAQMGASNNADLKSIESNFVKITKKFGENRGISYGAWRDSGVSADVLKRAGVARTRG